MLASVTLEVLRTELGKALIRNVSGCLPRSESVSKSGRHERGKAANGFESCSPLDVFWTASNSAWVSLESERHNKWHRIYVLATI